MIEDTMDGLNPLPMDQFERALHTNARTGRWTGLVLTGSEITLRSDLPDLARRARDAGFRHVRIQTHGMRLSNMAYLETLVESGVDEYFVSVTAATPDAHDSITAVPGSFSKTLQGLANLDRFDSVVSLTNTVITQRSYKDLAAVVERLADLRNLAQMEFWNYLPMSDEDDRGLLVSNRLIHPHLSSAINLAQAAGRAVVVKNFPECLLNDAQSVAETHHPETLIDPSYWDEYGRNELGQCIHWDQCGASNCFGMTSAYIKRFGWDEDILHKIETHPHGFAKDELSQRPTGTAVPVPIRRS